FAFVEFAHPDPAQLAELMTRMGFTATARHKTRNITLWRQGDVCYLANAEPNSFAAHFIDEHGPCAVGMGWHMVDPAFAYERALKLGAKPATTAHGALAVDAPAIEGRSEERRV